MQTGQILQASEFFKKPFEDLTRVRSELERANQGFRDKFLVCSVCGEKLRMLGGKSRDIPHKARNFHFAHLHNSNECPIKTTSRYSKEDINRMKYRGATESILHQELKAMIARGLYLNQSGKGQVSNIQIEKVIRSLDEQEWKKPDISLRFNEKRIAVELQLSTTWLDVITSRQEFYRAQNIYILWIFHGFERSDDFRKLTYSDILYTNNNNAYVFGRAQLEKSVETKDLMLTCHYLEYYADEAKVKSKWKNAMVTLDMLTYRPVTGQLFYFDSLSSKAKAESDAEHYRNRELERERQEKRERWQRIAEKQELNERLGEGLKERKTLENTIANKLRDIERLGQKLISLKERIPQLHEETQMLYLKLERMSLYGLPSSVASLVKELQHEFHEITEKIIVLNNSRNELVAREKNIKQLPEKTVGGKLYQVLSKIRDWGYITENYKTLFCFRIDQLDDLLNTPKVMKIVPHQLPQLQFNNKVDILADFSDRLSGYSLSLSQTDVEIVCEQERLIFFQRKFCSIVHQEFISYYNKDIEQTQKEIQNARLLSKESEQLLIDLNKLINVTRKDLEAYYYVEDDLEENW